MIKTFVKTQNVRNFIGLIENLQNKPKNIPKMALVYGEPGLGKSQTALWLACKYDAIYLRAANLMSARWLLEELVKEMDEIPSYLSSNNFNIIVRKLKAKPQLIIIDEINYLINDFKTIETLRDIHDKTECPIVFVGMSLVHKKLERYKHLYDSLSEIPFTTESIEYIYPKYNRFRQIVQLINQLETYAKDNGITEFTLETIRGLL